VVGRIRDICDKESIEYDEDALVYISEACEGHVRNAINMVEDISYLGKVTLDRAKELSRAFEEEVCTLICNLGLNLPECLAAAKGVTSRVSVLELYQQVIAMLNDTAKLIYGHDNLLPGRKHFVERIKDIHGYKVLEFLSYLVKRDKFVDRVGLQSDIVLLHYKFLSNSFVPKEKPPEKVEAPKNETHTTPQGTEDTSAPSQQITYRDLSKLSIEERSEVLRRSRKTTKQPSGDTDSNTETVPSNWPLPKDQRVGDDVSEDPELSPEDFSRLMVGGRGGGL
jgi:DNA polymerase III gamma/tau subunit